jgi:hypothetical protein
MPLNEHDGTGVWSAHHELCRMPLNEGTGFWSHLLRTNHQVDVVAYDMATFQTKFNPADPVRANQPP